MLNVDIWEVRMVQLQRKLCYVNKMGQPLYYKL